MICILHLQNFRYDYIRIFFRKNTTCQKIIGGAKPPPPSPPPHSLRHCNRRIMDIEHGTFTPLVFSVSGGMGKECSMFHKHVAEKISIKTEERYEKVLSTIRCKLSFIILKSVLMCVRGSRSYKLKNFDDFEIVSDLARITS